MKTTQEPQNKKVKPMAYHGLLDAIADWLKRKNAQKEKAGKQVK